MSLEHWVWLSSLRINKRWMHRLLERFVDPQRVYEATALELRDLQLGTAQNVILQARDLQTAKDIISQCEKENISIVTMRDAAYPNRLRNIEVPPVLLYVGGHMPSFDEEAVITIVGTRTSSARANEIAYRFGYELADKGMLVVSGIAEGIDSAANAGALAAGARTVGVLGSGIDVCYPSSSKAVYHSILAGNGCLISEYPPGDRPYSWHFPERNRIMSGLAAGVLVIAAPERSGSLITASRALEQGREIFVVPGNIDDAEFVGSNNLVKHGAIPVTTPKDIVAYYYARFPNVFNAAEVAAYMRDPSDQEALIRFNRRQPSLQVASKPVYVIEGKSVEQRPKGRARDYDFHVFSEFSKRGKQNRRGLNRERPRPDGRESSDTAAYTAPAEERNQNFDSLTEEQRKILSVLAEHADRTAHIDEIVNHSGFSVSEALTMLTELELDGVIVALPGKRFQIKE